MGNPNKLNIIRSQNIHYKDKEFYDNFVKKWNKTKDYQNALSIIEDNVELTTKKITKTIFNQISDGISYMENIYNSEFIEKLSSNYQTFQDNVNNYKIFNTYSEDWQYEKGQILLYNNYGYYSIEKPPKGTLPTNTVYWVKLDIKGNTGENSIGADLISSPSQWNSSINYSTLNAITYDYETSEGEADLTSAFYIARRDNKAKRPTENTSDWLELVKVKRNEISIGASEPEAKYSGQIWVQEL